MIKSVRGHFVKQEFLSTQLVITVRNILRRIQSLKLSDMLSEDMKYRLYFFRSYLPELYRRHIKKNYRNCLFCSRLVKTGCHKYCLKCSAGTYIKCCPPLPGFLYDVAIHAEDDYTPARSVGTTKNPALISKGFHCICIGAIYTLCPPQLP